jgi:glycerol-3-phosphate dehydrogenase (NAD(P)+)
VTNHLDRIGIIGGGAWGTALAVVARQSGREVVLWAREEEVVEAVNRRHENPLFLPGVPLDPGVRATSTIAEAAEGGMLLVVVPAQHLRETTRRLAACTRPEVPVVICAKGIEQETGALMSEVVAETMPAQPVAVLSGPTFAAEVARGLPTAVTLAAQDAALGERLIRAIGSRAFRPYLSNDVVGAQIGGAVKNVLAIACGIVEGRGLGDNARAALITRGLAEMVRLGLAKGARAHTLMGLSGLGDLTLTCNGAQSRNMSLGAALGLGRSLAEVMAERRSVAEGVFTASSVVALAERLGVEMPISAAVDLVLNRGADIDETIRDLLSRPFTTEIDEAAPLD